MTPRSWILLVELVKRRGPRWVSVFLGFSCFCVTGKVRILSYRLQCDGVKPACQLCVQRQVPDSCRYDMGTKTATERMIQELRRLHQRNKYLELDIELLRERNVWHLEDNWRVDLEEENRSLREKNKWAEKIISSLTDDRLRIEIIDRLRRSESHQVIARWLTSTFPSTQSPPPYSTAKQQVRPADIEGEEAVEHKSMFLEGSSRLDRETGTSTQRKGTSIITETAPTDSPTKEDYSGDSSGASTESDLGEDIASTSPEKATWLTIAYAKHQMMISLMRDVYNIANFQWKADFRSRTGSQAANTGEYAPSSSSLTPTSRAKGKRRMQDRESPPPDAKDEKKRKSRSSGSGDSGPERLFACSFYKFNAQKYCSNSDTGTKYRSCAGPGFSKISQLK